MAMKNRKAGRYEYKKKQLHRSGRPIRGSDGPFTDNKEFKRILENISLQYIDTYGDARRAFKQIAADRLRIAAIRCGQYVKFSSTDINSVCTYLDSCGYAPAVARFVKCVLDGYNNEELCAYRAVCRNSAYGTNKEEWVHAIKDIEFTYKRHMKNLTQKLMEKSLTTHPSDKTSLFSETVERYCSLGTAVEIICSLFELLFIRPLPVNVSPDIYAQMQKEAPRIGRQYEKKNALYKRKRGVKKPRIEYLGLTGALQISLINLVK